MPAVEDAADALDAESVRVCELAEELEERMSTGRNVVAVTRRSRSQTRPCVWAREGACAAQ